MATPNDSPQNRRHPADASGAAPKAARPAKKAGGRTPAAPEEPLRRAESAETEVVSLIDEKVKPVRAPRGGWRTKIARPSMRRSRLKPITGARLLPRPSRAGGSGSGRARAEPESRCASSSRAGRRGAGA